MTMSRDLSMRAVARRMGRSRGYVEAIWDAIPGAYRAPSGRGYAPEWGVKEWQAQRGGRAVMSVEARAAAAGEASIARPRAQRD